MSMDVNEGLRPPSSAMNHGDKWKTDLSRNRELLTRLNSVLTSASPENEISQTLAAALSLSVSALIVAGQDMEWPSVRRRSMTVECH